MSTVAPTAITLLLSATPALAARGDEDGDGTAAARSSAATPAPTPESEISVGLAGTWKATLKRSQLAAAPDDLRGDSP